MNKLASIAVGGSNPVRIMGILNVSPESFYKKSIKTKRNEITETVKKMEDQGADFIDVGGMSTAPYLSTIISEKIEAKRIMDAIKIIQNKTNLPISVDTCRASVAVQALELGSEIINDISGLKYDRQMIDVVRIYEPDLILCAFSKNLVTGNQVKKTKELLKQSLKLAKSSGISSKKIVLDPAIGFFRKIGKGPFFTKINSHWLQRDLSILANLKSIKQNQPLLVSVSNKSFLGKIMNKKNPSDRLPGSLATEVLAVINGADIIRTHNVRETHSIVSIAKKLSRLDKSL
ncbi:MAG: dihydropteroate synthase [Marine Group I thaumarchaeote]|nr:MAG: dihydropteroate synthase [Marine Group I thaumarchaeote]